MPLKEPADKIISDFIEGSSLILFLASSEEEIGDRRLIAP
jgi:hypothetical protein